MKDRIKQLRQTFGLTQSEFAEKIGLARTGIASLEQGERKVSERHIRLILAAFPRVNEAWLRFGEGEMFLPDLTASRADALAKKWDFEGVMAKLLEAFYLLDEEQQKAVLQMTMTFIASLQEDEPPAADADPDAAQPETTTTEDLQRIYDEANRIKDSYILEKTAELLSSDSITDDGASAG